MQLTTPFKFHAVIRLLRLRHNQFVIMTKKGEEDPTQQSNQVRCFKFQGFHS